MNLLRLFGARRPTETKTVPPSESGTALVKLVVGLGNPGRKYQKTRHNIGFDILAELAAKRLAGPPRHKFHGELTEFESAAGKTLLLCPHTYMNRSGISVRAAVDFYKIDTSAILIVCDDFNLPLGKLRIRGSGSGGGQKGLTHVIQRLGTDQLARLRFGIDPPPENWSVTDYVLSRISKDEQEIVDRSVRRAVQCVEDWISHGVDYCMNQYNGT